jgi:signal transduction histidine kinase
MKRLSLQRLQRMSIRTRLLVLMLLVGAAVFVNLLTLANLAHSVSTSLANFENARARQLLALTMYKALSDAETALNRYQLGNYSGFAAQFEFDINNFGTTIQAYRALAATTDEQSWVNELDQIRDNIQGHGKELIRLHSQQADDLRVLPATQRHVTNLLAEQLKSPRMDGALQELMDNLQSCTQTMTLAVGMHLATPEPVSYDQFRQATQQCQENLNQFRRLTITPTEQNDLQQITTAFAELQTLGMRLIDNRDQQQLLFTQFSAEIFEAHQRIIFQQIQPFEEQRLSQAQQNLQTEIATVMLSNLLASGSLTLLALAVALRLARTMNRNVFALLRGADRVARGNLEESVRVDSTDELKRLAEAFNMMMSEIAIREQGLKVRLAELETLREVNLQMTSSLNLDQVLNTIASSALDLVRATSVQIFTRDENVPTLRLAASAGAAMDMESAHSLATSAATTGWLQSIPANSTAALPMRLGAQVLGVLHVASDPRETLAGEDVHILRLLTDQAAVALGNARLHQNLIEREERERTLLQKMTQLQEEERRLIGLDLHDGLMQLIMSANMHLTTLNSNDTSALDPRAQEKLESSRAMIKRAIKETRRVIAELRPTEIEDWGLVEGLQRHVRQVSEENNWECETQIDLDGIALSAPVQAAIFRIAQEALSNARNYSDTCRIRVILQIEGADLMLRVQDWGCGFDPASVSDEREHLGLVSMRERALTLGGKCEIISQPGQGTIITVRVPLIALKGTSHEFQHAV